MASQQSVSSLMQTIRKQSTHIYQHILYTPIKSSHLTQFEQKTHRLLPREHKEFLTVSHGADLFKRSNIDGFHFLSVNEIETVRKNLAREYGEDWDDTIIPFCTIIGEGNTLSFKLSPRDPNTYEILDCFHEVNPSEWQTIDTSFSHFLKTLIEKNGDKFWL